MTRWTDLQEAQRILREILHYGDNSYLELVLTEHDLMDAVSWMYFTDAQIASLTYTGDNGVIHHMHPDDYLMLLVFRLYVSRQLASETNFYPANVSRDDFDMFVRSNVGTYAIQAYRSMFTVAPAANVNNAELPRSIKRRQTVYNDYDTRAELTSSSSSSSCTDPICSEDNKSDTAKEASIQDDCDVKDKSINIVSLDSNETMDDVPNDITIEQNIEDVQLEEDTSIEIVFYETKEPTNVFNESFAESFVTATTPFFCPDTDYSDYSTGSVLEPTNVNIPIDKVCRHLTLDPGVNESIIGKVEEPMVQEDTLADDADTPVDILPNREAIDCVLSTQMINPTPAAVETSPAVQGLTLNGRLSSQMINPIPAAVEILPAVQGLTLNRLLSRQFVKSMVNTMDWNTKDSTGGKSNAICEIPSYSSAYDMRSIHCNDQVDAYSGAMVAYQPNDGLVNKDLDVVEIVDKCCSVNVACSDGHSLCLSVMTGARIQTCFDSVIAIAHINAFDQGSTDRTVCRHEAFDHRIYDKGKIFCSVSQSNGQVTNVMRNRSIHIVHTSPTEWITSTIMLELVSDGKYWIDALHDKVISLLKGILSLRGGYAQYLPAAKEDTVISNCIMKRSEIGDELPCLMTGWFSTQIMEIIQQVTLYVVFTGSNILKKCSTITCPITNVFRCLGHLVMMCAKQLVFTPKNLCERGAMSKMLLNRTSLLLAMGYVCLLMNHTFYVPIHTSSLITTTRPNPHLCPELVFTWWEPVYKKVNNLNFPHEREKLGRYVDIAPNIDPTMTDTMDVMRHFDHFAPICMADGEPRHRRPAPIDGESIRKHVKFRNSFVLHVAKVRSSPSMLPPFLSLMVNHVKDLKSFNNSQSDPGSSRDISCCARIDIDRTSCPMKPCRVEHQANVDDHNSQSDPGSSRDFSCCDRIDIEWPHVLMQTGQTIIHMSHAMFSTSIKCESITTKMMLRVNIQSKIYHPGDINNISKIPERAGKVVAYFVVEDEVFVKKEKINIEDKFVFELKKMNNNNDVVDSNGRGVLDFPKPRVTRVAHDSCDRAQQASVDRVSARVWRVQARVWRVPVLLTNTTTVNSVWNYMDDVDSDVVGAQTYDTHDIRHSCERNEWISLMDIHGGADRFEKANRTSTE